ncbi:SDR family NAD(P)-dependent oxidoreductase [Azospirillum sp. YIM B02556]|uniref:SDR family NAD(P)-dependent oxidoreductase n=1 Tax=Azospirillum endophyticum TaxID=2800326 RepID=A0ABS1F1B3_9PROT|nr:oxidoreductase [Azospirillum endophyticum]MBK1837204.1 SDR family NAD(P)-dependent oxidoreductase [Azospirillum endophyticum]
MSKVWFITGSARGIGAEVAKAALAAGDRVVATGRNLDRLREIYADHGESVLPVVLDVADEAQAVTAVQAAVDRFGRIDVLVNNAGFGLLGRFEEIEAADIERQFATNVFGLFHVTRAVLPVMRRQRSGRILNLSSIGGVLGFAGASVYCSTKYAVEGFSDSLALEAAPFGIHVTVVEPGFFRTDFLDGSSVRYGGRRIEDYAAHSAELRSTYDGYSRKQPGDPVKLAAIMVELAGTAEPPRHFLAGSDAVEMATGAIERRGAEIAAWRDRSKSTDFAA